MPEKPEVMTVCKALEKQIINKRITDCNIYWDNIIAKPEPILFKKNIINQKIHNIFSKGKFIVIELDDYYLLIHLRMEGKFTFRKINEEKEKHEHVEFILDNEISWRYRDVRKFGKMYLIEKDKLYEEAPLNKLGYDYYDKDLTGDYLYNKIHPKKLPIKTVLLDQSIISGIGNIYDDEILFLSKISPIRKASDVSKKECNLIVNNTKNVLEKAFKLGGTTIKSFTSSEGVHGLFQNELLVHGQVGKKCPNCNEEIIKIKVGGRGTYYCPKCQK